LVKTYSDWNIPVNCGGDNKILLFMGWKEDFVVAETMKKL
jgi:hypothetical protein